MKIKLSAAVILVSLALAACGSASRGSSPTTTTTYKASPTTTVSNSVKVDAYVSAMQRKFPAGSRADLIKLGQLACETIAEAGSITGALVDMASKPSWSGLMESAGYTMGAAVPVFCPQYLRELELLTK